MPEIGRLFAKDSVAVVSFAIWEEGILTARGNPKNIRGIEDFAEAGSRSSIAKKARAPGVCSMQR